ncbi:Hypothetical_protein [Hexamita inflata]|uniref:Hypothetical_protein n=1 Tax=Hexamita inflata TaxID=28002 RepID=A0AA86URS2_9EUKA|nr:Hypothetical protein HINF_LOCUS53144 [Hexamita inflata]
MMKANCEQDPPQKVLPRLVSTPYQTYRSKHFNQTRESCEMFNQLPDLIRIQTQIKLQLQGELFDMNDRLIDLEEIIDKISANVNKLGRNHRFLIGKISQNQ